MAKTIQLVSIAGRRSFRAWPFLALTLAVGAAAESPTRYDYIVVGAGTAGSVVANRLSENPDLNVLVLEAGGPDDDERIYQPSAFRQLPGSSMDWGYSTEQEEHLNHREIPWPRGKVWGGSGAISAMVYVRGLASDFDAWEKLGNPGWNYEAVLPYFKKAENQERGPSRYHGVGGPQNVADPRWKPPISEAFIAAALEAGIPGNEDFNGATQEGVGLYQLNQKNGERHSAATAYLRPALRRRNVTVESYALASRILFDGLRAVGVTYLKDHEFLEARADREVILCAGTIGSPQLLMLSGIGPADHLESLDIPVIRNLPGVGANLQDHPRVAVTYAARKTLGFVDPSERDDAVREYYTTRSGPLSSNGVGAGAFVRRSEPDRSSMIQIILTADTSRNVFSVHAALMHPRSRGWIRLRSKDPAVYPVIRASYLEDERDLRGLVEGLEIARRIAESDGLRDYRGKQLSPGAEMWGGEEIAEFVRSNLTTFYHAVGTCRMGPDGQAVVDRELRVHGIEGLRVIDASIMPTIISGATHAATVMIAEKGADMIKMSW